MSMGSSSAHRGAQPTKILHGDLSLHIIEARSLPNMDVLSHHLRRCFTPCCSASSPKEDDVDDGHHRSLMSSDAYVTLVVPQCTLARTHVIKNNPNPMWDQKFQIPLAHPISELEFRVKDNDVFGAEHIGTVRISANDVSSGERITGWFPILRGSSSKPPKPDTALHLDLTFTPFDRNPIYQKGAREITDVYFPMRKGGKMKLYQDAHVSSHGLPAVELEGGVKHAPSSCWEDICHAISEAHHLIYIVGWSVFHKIKLIREPTKPLPRGGDLTLGDLLKYKSEEGVRVLLLVWDDKTSHDTLGFKTDGVMLTHDEETKRFFKHSSVTCVLAPRYASRKMSVLKQQIVGTIFTHHQKCVLVDTQASGNDRKVTAFLGGLDLCDGRYDTPEHRLFRSLDTVFKDDFHNPTFPAGMKAPRQPWHDLHCRIDGPAAYDVLINFQQRWRKSTKLRKLGKKVEENSWKNDALLRIERISWIRCPPLKVTEEGVTIVPAEDPTVYVTEERDGESWHVQIFRSIDSGSLKGFPKTTKECESNNLTCAKNLVVEKSIQTAYIQAIRSAQHFIYIENQYFLGSSYAWGGYKNAGADNLIPMELALKIASKIRAGERFAVYVVIPMWPEGNPTSEVMQEILYWQSQTMEMMYTVVAREIKATDTKGVHPEDYLNFFCLGNREEMGKGVEGAGAQSEAYKNQRFMIYVHAKGMIVDDEYVIVGTANINQRSMAGSKDTELAMGAYQRGNTWRDRGRHPRGDVFAYRMGLWGEHMGPSGMLHDAWSLDTVRRVRKIGEDNWRRFAGDEFRTLDGHLLKYPLNVADDGKVSPLPGYELFPDVGGSVIGAHSFKLPDALTT